MVLQMRQQGNLQDYPGGPSVVRGLPMAAMSGWGDNLEKPHLIWVMDFGKKIIYMIGLTKWLALLTTELSIGRKSSLHLQ